MTDSKYLKWAKELEWYVISTHGDGAQAFLVPASELRDAMHEEMCCCGAAWPLCKTEGILDDILRLDDPQEWTCDYPSYTPSRFSFDFEDGGIEIIKLSEHPYTELSVSKEDREFIAHARADIPALVKLVRELLQQVAKIAIPLEAMFIYGNEASLSPAMADGLRKARDIARSIALTGVPQEEKQ